MNLKRTLDAPSRKASSSTTFLIQNSNCETINLELDCIIDSAFLPDDVYIHHKNIIANFNEEKDDSGSYTR